MHFIPNIVTNLDKDGRDHGAHHWRAIAYKHSAGLCCRALKIFRIGPAIYVYSAIISKTVLFLRMAI